MYTHDKGDVALYIILDAVWGGVNFDGSIRNSSVSVPYRAANARVSHLQAASAARFIVDGRLSNEGG